MNRCLTFILLPAALFAAPAFAQDQAAAPAGPAPDVSGDSITIGVGGVYMPDYEGSNDYRLSPAPGVLASVHGFNFTLAGDRASLDIIPDRSKSGWDFQAGPVAGIDFNRSTLSQIEDLRVHRLGKRDSSLEVGGFVGIGKTGIFTSPYDKLSFSVSYRKGISGANRAGILSPTLTYFTPVSRKAAIGVLASAERAERGYAEVYYDVDAAQSLRSGLPVFHTRGGWKNYAVGLLGTRAITGDLLHGFKLVGVVSYTHLLNDFADSPIVSIAGSKSQWLGILGVAYTF